MGRWHSESRGEEKNKYLGNESVLYANFNNRTIKNIGRFFWPEWYMSNLYKFHPKIHLMSGCDQNIRRYVSNRGEIRYAHTP